MKNPSKRTNNFKKININQNLGYNNPLIKNRKSIPILSKKKYINPSRKYERALISLKEGLAELSNEFLDEERPYRHNHSHENTPIKNMYYSAQKNRYNKKKNIKC